MEWFSYLKENGFFDPIQNPSPIKTENGYNVPYWSVLDYLEKLAVSISKGENTALAPELIQVIKDVSENPVDNYHTWYHFIKIVAVLPNDIVTSEVLQFIPAWFSSQVDTMLQTQELCTKLLPKFVTVQATQADINKAETILGHLFDLTKNDSVTIGNGYSISQYSSPFYLYFLSNDLLEGGLMESIAKRCSLSPVIKLMDSINFLLRDVPVKAHELYEGKGYTFEINRHFEKLTIKVIIDENDSQITDEKIIENYLDYSHSELNTLLIEIYEMYSIPVDVSSKINARLRFNLENDMISLFGQDGIRNLDEDKHGGHNETLNTFSLILRDWLSALAQDEDSHKIKDLFGILENEKRYKLPFFIRMKLYITAQNWPGLKDWFNDSITTNDKKGLFSNDVYKLELYYLLSSIAGKLQSEEAGLISNIFDQGPIVREFYDPSPEYWRHRWLDALKDQPEFSEEYRTSQEKLKVSTNYNEEGKITVRVGNVSPFSKEQIMAMPYNELVDTIHTFKNNDRWEDPTIEGLADVLCDAIEEEPQHFTQILADLNDVKYIYVYKLLYGFSKATKNKKEFDWQPVLEFANSYISSNVFGSGGLSTNEGLNVNPDWIYGSIASLISDGSHDETGAYDAHQFPIIKSLLLKLDSLAVRKSPEKLLDDYVTSAVNTTYGIVLQAIIMYSLKVARNTNTAVGRWDSDLMAVYTGSLEKYEIEAFTFLAMYLRQLMFLDQQWLEDKLRKVKDYNDLCRAAFIDGLAFTNPLSKNYYKILYPLYDEFSLGKASFNRRNKSIINHLLSYYLQGIEISDEDAPLIKLLNNHPESNIVSTLITSLSRLRKELPLEPIHTKKILKLWRIINAEVSTYTDTEDLKLVSNIAYLNEFLIAIDDETIKLVTDNINVITSNHNLTHFIANLLAWSENSDPGLIAQLVGHIKFDYYFDIEKTKKLVEFLYLSGYIETANNTVNKISMRGYDNFRELYEKYA